MSILRRLLRWIRSGALVVAAGAGLLVLLSAASNLGLSRSSAVVERLSQVQKARVAEAYHLRQSLGDTIWPGWGSAALAQIVYNEGYVFLLQLPDPQPGWYREPSHTLRGEAWSAVPADEFLGRPYYRQPLDDGDPTPEAFAVRVGDRWTGSIMTQEWARLDLGREIRSNIPSAMRWIPPYRILGRLFFRDAEHHISLILHESFHAFQGKAAWERFRDAEGSATMGEEYPWRGSDLEEAWGRETGLLADALEAESDAGSRALAREFLQVRKERRSALSSDLVAYERDREWVEGPAKYVETRSLLAAHRATDYRSLCSMAVDSEFREYRGAEEAWSREVAQLRRAASGGRESRFYYTGMAQAVLLDRLAMEGWKARAMNDGMALEDLLAEAVRSGSGPPPLVQPPSGAPADSR